MKSSTANEPFFVDTWAGWCWPTTAGVLSIESVHAQRFEEAHRLRLRYRDKPRISFTDLTSFAVMRELGIRHVLTGDAHFAQVGLGFHQLP